MSQEHVVEPEGTESAAAEAAPPVAEESVSAPTPPQTKESPSIDLLLDVPMSVTVELGRTRMQVRQLLALAAGSVVELGKLAGEPLDILVNGRTIARGEAVMVNEKFGVRLTEIVSRSERVESMR